MKKHLGKQISVMLAVILAAFACVAGVSPARAQQVSAGTDIPSEVAGMDRYIHEADGFLSLDVVDARRNGYTADAVEMVANQIDGMNRLLEHDNAYLAGDGTVIVQNPSSGATMFRAARARGVNKTVAHWWGVTEYWVDSNRANQLVNGLKKGQQGVAAVNRILPIGGFLRGATNAYMAGLAYNAAAAAKPGRGIIMFTRPNPGSTTTMAVWFGPQP